MKKKFELNLDSFLFKQEDLEQDNGQLMGLGSEKKWYCINEDSPQGECTICADLETSELYFRTITSVNQLSLDGAVAEVCEEYQSRKKYYITNSWRGSDCNEMQC